MNHETKEVKVSSQRVDAGSIFMGIELDNNTKRIVFKGIPDFGSDMQVTMHWGIMTDDSATGEDEPVGDVATLEQDVDRWIYTVTNNLTQYANRPIRAYIEVLASENKVWHTREFAISVIGLPDVDGKIEQAYPSAISEAMEQIRISEAETAANAEQAVQSEMNAAASALQATQSANEAAQNADRAQEYAEQIPPVMDAAIQATEAANSAAGAAQEAVQRIDDVMEELPEEVLKVAAPVFTGTRYLTPTQPATLHTVTPGSTIYVTADAALTLTHNGAQVPMTAGQTITLTATGGDTLSTSAGQPLVKYSQQSDAVRYSAQPKTTDSGPIAQVSGVWPDTGMEVTARNYITQPGTPTPDAPIAVDGAVSQAVLQVRGKNLCPRGTDATIEGITAQWQSDDSVILNGTVSSAGAAFNILGAYNSTPEVIPGSSGQTFSISGGHDGVVVRAQSYDPSSGTRLSYDSAGGASSTFTLPVGRVLTRLVLQINYPATLVNVRIYPQLELGSTVTTYEPYTDYSVTAPLPSPLYGLPDAMDEVDLTNGKVTRPTKRMVLTGEEGWATSGASVSSGKTYQLRADDIVSAGIQTYGGVNSILTSHFVRTPNVNMPEGRYPGVVFSYTNADGSKYIQFVAAQATVAEFKAWLAAQYAAGTPVTVYYQLAMPVTEQIDPLTLPAPSEVATAYANTRETEVRALMSGDGVRALIDDLQAQITALTGA